MSKTSSGVELARRHLAAGRFGEAIRAAQSEASLDSPEQCLVLAEARWRVGQLGAAATALDRCANADGPLIVCKAAEIRANLAREEGRFKEAIALFNRCIDYAETRHDLSQMCRAQLALFGVLLDQHGSQACESLATEVRRNVIRSGEPFLFGWLHRQFAEFEARAGNSSRAFRHLEAGFQTVALNPNPWLLGSLWIVQSSVEGLNGSISDALRSARKARESSRLSGHEKTRWAALSNIGYLSIWAGDSTKLRPRSMS